jgi:WD40 repeat protein/ABC-type sugar transport system ATPase subunit
MPVDPYPGLRPFKPEEHTLFFGQERNLDELFQNLSRNHFIAVLGESGCGKSSLVRAGLIPMLVPMHEGAVKSWRVVVAQPGKNPISNLAQAMQDFAVPPTSDDRANIEAMLREGPMGLIGVIERCKNKSTKFLLVVIDQFEELFRFRRDAQLDHRDDEAALYVKLLLHAAQREESDTYVLITMRSEYLGEAAQFYQLAEAISDGLFLLPRMKRVQCEDAIVQPALSAGTKLQQSIVQRFLNETEEREDGLPLLQHGLRRLWDKANHGERPRNVVLPTEFSETSGIDYVGWSLNEHLDMILGELDSTEQDIAAKLFKLLGESDSKGRLVRRPTEWREIKTISTDPKCLLRVINAFRDEKLGRTFLVPSIQQTPTFADDDKVDISHEVLLRRWTTYGKWLKHESENSAHYEWLADAADRWAVGKGGLLHGLELSSLVTWEQEFGPSSTWAARYTGIFDEDLKRKRRDYHAAMAYLEASQAEFKRNVKAQHDKEEEEKRLRIEAEVGKLKRHVRIGALFAFLIGAVLIAFFYQREKILAVKEQTLHDVVAYDDTIATAKQQGLVMDQRVPAAIKAAKLAYQSKEVDLQARLGQQIGLDQWELFSAVRKGKSLNSERGHLRSSCGVSLDPSGNYVALADGHSLRIWALAGDLHAPIATLPINGITCVRFSQDGRRLIAAVYPGIEDSTQLDVSSIATIEAFSFKDGSLKVSASSLDKVPALMKLSFVPNPEKPKSAKIAALALNGLLIYVPGHKAPDTVSLTSPAQMGFFSSDGRYLATSLEDGTVQIFKLDSDELPQPKAIEFRGDKNSDTLQSAAFSSDSSRIVTGSSRGWITVQDNPFEATDSIDQPHVVGQMSDGINAVAITINKERKELIAVGSDARAAAVLQVSSPTKRDPRTRPVTADPRLRVFGSYIAQVVTLQDAVTWVDFAEDGNSLLTASADQKARVFEAGSGIERERIPHQALVLFAAATKAGILSASEDADLEITDASKQPLAKREWLPEACSPEASALSLRNDWAWACAGKIYFFDGHRPTLVDNSAAPATVRSMYFSSDGSVLVWLTQDGSSVRDPSSRNYYRLHYSAWVDNRWINTIEVLPPTFDSPIIALSADASLIVVAYSSEIKRNWMVEAFNSNKTSPNLKKFDQFAHAVKSRVLSLAIAPDGSVAAGTVTNSVLYWKRQGNDWQEMPERFLGAQGDAQPIGLTSKFEGTGNGVPKTETVKKASGAGGSNLDRSNAVNHIVTALTFANDGQLLAARGDKTIWVFRNTGLDAGILKDIGSQDCDRFVFNAGGTEFAAIGGNSATFFELHDDRIIKKVVLQEPGSIQAVVLGNENTVTTSVAVNESLTRVSHNLAIAEHEKRICEEQPSWSNDTIKDCILLRELALDKPRTQ